MKNIKILDCTLRDGGYCNQWRFGCNNIEKIIKRLDEAKIDIIECGFISSKNSYDNNITKFCKVEDINPFIKNKRNESLYVAMINYGEYEIEDISPRDHDYIDGIRVAFHKKNMKEALEFCKKLKIKGYKVFVQPMVSVSYSDEEFLDLIRQINQITPYAFYIVDSFGGMKERELIRFFYMVEKNLQKDIWIGFHSHNNMQLAYSNAQKLATIHTQRNIIIDTSIYGMGRGAGNLNTELFVEFLNENIGTDYKLKPLLAAIDETINDFYQQNYWGYSLPNYLSAKHNAHPNYAKYLDDQKTLTVEDMDSIFELMDRDKFFEYDSKYIENIYLKYMNLGKIQNKHQQELEKILKDKTILLIAPGKSILEEEETIIKLAQEKDVIVISVNFDYEQVNTDFIFLSNLRRFREISKDKYEKCIITSNIPLDNVYFQAKYNDLLNEEEAVKDKAGLMAIKFFMDFKIKKIMLIGYDGYSHDTEENYGDKNLAFYTRNAVLDAMNEGMRRVIKKYSQKVYITFLSQSKYFD